MALSVPTPILSVDGSPVSETGADKAVTLSCGPVLLPDGSPLVAEDTTAFGFRLLRRNASGTLQLWDEAATGWVASAETVDPAPLAFQDGRWQMILAAMGPKDADGNDKLATDRASGYPEYLVRCDFRGRDASGTEHAGTSPPSSPLRIYPAGSDHKAGLATTPAIPAAATEIRLYLKDAALVERGSVRITATSGGYRIELVTPTARVRLESNGDIVLTPASGAKVKVEGDLEVRDALTAGGRVL
jgi:hypothetical protein